MRFHRMVAPATWNPWLGKGEPGPGRPAALLQLWLYSLHSPLAAEIDFYYLKSQAKKCLFTTSPWRTRCKYLVWRPNKTNKQTHTKKLGLINVVHSFKQKVLFRLYQESPSRTPFHPHLKNPCQPMPQGLDSCHTEWALYLGSV